MNEYNLKIEELFEKKLMSNYKMSLQQFKELDDYTKDKLIQGMYILRDNLKKKEKNKVKAKIK